MGNARRRIRYSQTEVEGMIDRALQEANLRLAPVYRGRGLRVGLIVGLFAGVTIGVLGTLAVLWI